MNRADRLEEAMHRFDKDTLVESINDKNIFKAIIMAGGPGSGKSFISDNVLGKSGSVSALGAVVINSDAFVEYLFPKFHLPLVFDKSKPEQYKQQLSARELAGTLAKNRAMLWLEGMLPVVIDGTGKNYDKVVSQTTCLRQLGYDVSLIFVNTTLDVSQDRNALRDRKVDPKDVEAIWTASHANIGKFQKFFGAGEFHVIDNSVTVKGPDAVKLKTDLFRVGKQILEKPLHNPIGKAVVAALKAIGGKYFSDLERYTGKSVSFDINL